jgi:protein-S-isoprenylcysteine O-methyltransferase Ste14
LSPLSRLLDRGLVQERMRPGGRPTPLGLRLLNVVLLTHWIVAGLDRGWLQALGLFTIVAGYALVFWAMMTNRFFSSVVRIQSDRGQYVVTSGPYWLAAAFLIAITVPFLFYRVIHEDRVLQTRLDGYADYARRVRWRLVPGIW